MVLLRVPDEKQFQYFRERNDLSRIWIEDEQLVWVEELDCPLHLDYKNKQEIERDRELSY